MYDHHFSNFGRPPVSDDLCKDSATRHPQFWRSIFLKVFTIYETSWSMDGNYFSNLSFPCPTEAQNKIWATLAQRLQRRGRLKFSKIFPYTCIGKQTWPLCKRVAKDLIRMLNVVFRVTVWPVHYENMPIQVYRKCHLQKLKI